MNVSELIERLQDCDPEAEVLIATQPNWPLAYHLSGVATPEDIAGETRCEDHGSFSCDEDECQPTESVVWLAEGSQRYDNPYAPRAAWDVAS